MDIKTFFDKSKLNFEAMDNLSAMLDEAGFKRLNEEDKWDLKTGGKYYVIKNETSLFAFRMGKDSKNAFTIVGSHSDSPGFRIKPNPEMVKEDVVVLNTEVYGGPLLYTWFDRPLSIGGKVTVDSGDPLKPRVIKYRSKENLMVIPSVAIHMNREANKGWEINPQEHTLPVVGLDKDFKLIPYIEKEIGEKIISHELYLINDNDFEYVGVNDDFFMTGRIDNLGMAFASVNAIINAKGGDKTAVAYVSDNEEIGSMTAQGAFAPFFRDTLERIVVATGGNFEDFRIALKNSFMISADQAHAAHPNFGKVADPTNRPRMNEGPVIKVAANGAYTSDANSIAVFRSLAKIAGVKTQTFVNRSDKRGGSTIASITTSKIDIPIVDVGNPVWGMHSAVETSGVKDQEAMEKIMTTLFEQ